MIDRESLLTATLRDWRGTRFVWGQTDCMMSVLAYAGLLTGTDPGAPWRGLCKDQANAVAILDGIGGIVAGLEQVLGAAGFKRVQAPERGDIVIATIGACMFSGLCLGDRAAFRLDGRGVLELAIGRVKVEAAWR